MAVSKRIVLMCFLAFAATAVFGCSESDPTADVPPEQMAPENVEDNPGYAEAMGGK